MYSCQKCGKEYSRQKSLNRHMQNHNNSGNNHACHLCNITFHRRDLLARHSKIHQQKSVSSSEGILSNGRRRCHTACVRCRELRTKCDGQHPCQRCIDDRHDCEFNRGAGRISQCLLNSNEVTRAALSPRDATHDRHDEDNGAFPSPTSLSEPTCSNGQIYQPEPSTSISQSDTFLLPDLPPSANEADSMHIDSVFETTAWPWIHESLFLPADWSLGWPDGETGYPFQQVTDGAFSDDSARRPSQMRIGESGIGNLILPAVSDFPTSFAAEQLQTHEKDHAAVPQLEGSSNHIAKTPTGQSKLIEMMVTDAAREKSLSSKPDHAEYWNSMSGKVQSAFSIPNQPVSSSHTLGDFVDLYLQNFGPLWPLLSRQGLHCDQIHPLLYLTLASIGAMYGGAQAAHFGTVLHNRLRQSLTTSLELGGVDDELLWLGQARLLTQVAALYFGQSKAFSYAQHLGGVLVAQARRMDIFSAPRTRYGEKEAALSKKPEDRLSRWLLSEGRRRLAFGILRAETYTSVLLNTRPLISPEEIDLELPCSDQTWRGPALPLDIYLALVERDHTTVKAQRFSDTIRIALERDERFSVLDPIGNELLIFGLQQAVWRFSHDYYMFERLTGRQSGPTLSTTQRRASTANLSCGRSDDHLVTRPQGMHDLEGDLDRLTNALRRWKQSFKSISNELNLQRDRNSILSSLLLFHLSFMRLHAPIDDLHHISYRMADERSIESSIIGDISRWANSRRGYIAVRHALTIWSLISREVQRPEDTRAKFNFLAFLGLHHAAVVLWTYAGAHEFQKDYISNDTLTIAPLGNSDLPIPVRSSTMPSILRLFSDVFSMISPGRWSSFGAAASKLSERTFPRLEPS
ncbi:hypothetical protein BKA64DRAFT_564850 [Cadophora sp. MPI-SDFR-AT-0126]|nr:hypothetical protein BKA64DRAFT_564850 [Leotiomycetes sp. MPI-SDFR-AT-0126]